MTAAPNPKATLTATTPITRVGFICHHMNRPVTAQSTSVPAVMSANSAQNQVAPTLRG